MTVTVRPLAATDHDAWLILARGYKAFYETETTAAEFETAWRRLIDGDGVHGLGAFVDGRMVGLVHHLFHTSVWARQVCYLQDLFTAPEARGQGVARALIAAVAAAAREAGAARCYWLTRENNRTARALYDKVATFHGFIRYDVAL